MDEQATEVCFQMFRRGMEEAAKLLDQEATSAASLAAEFKACDLRGRMELVREHMQTMAGTVRHFAADDEWCKSALEPEPQPHICGLQGEEYGADQETSPPCARCDELRAVHPENSSEKP